MSIWQRACMPERKKVLYCDRFNQKKPAYNNFVFIVNFIILVLSLVAKQIVSQNSNQSLLSPQRINTLSDGVFAIAMTFLVLDVKNAVIEVPEDNSFFLVLLPKLCSYILGFVILGLFWNGHHIASHYIKRADRVYLWLNIHFLLWAALIPFPAQLLGERYFESLSVVVYGTNLSFAAIALYAAWWYATDNRRLVSDNLSKQTIRSLKTRLLSAIGSYLVAGIVALFNPVSGIVVFVISHVYFVFRPVARIETFK